MYFPCEIKKIKKINKIKKDLHNITEYCVIKNINHTFITDLGKANQIE